MDLSLSYQIIYYVSLSFFFIGSLSRYSLTQIIFVHLTQISRNVFAARRGQRQSHRWRVASPVLVVFTECLRTGWYTRVKRCVLREICEICVRNIHRTRFRVFCEIRVKLSFCVREILYISHNKGTPISYKITENG